MIMKEYLKRAGLKDEDLNEDLNKDLNEAVNKKSVMDMLKKEQKNIKSMSGRLRGIQKKVKSEDIETAIENTIVTLTNTFDEFLSDMDMFIDEL